MLNYYQIDMGGTRDEKLNKKEKKDFLDRLNASYDAHTVHDILSKIRDKFQNKPQEDDEEKDPFFDSLKDSDEFRKEEPLFPPGGMGFHKDEPFGINPEIEKFLDWMTNLLYSADHKVIISEEGDITNIKLQKIKKRGGRKK